MARPTKRQATCALLVVALLGAPACAAPAIGAGGKPVPRVTAPKPVIGAEPDRPCKGPPDKRVVAFDLAPQTTLVDLVAWISSVVCKPFLLPGTAAVENKTLTPIAPERMTAEQAYRFFLGALASIGLKVERDGQLLRIVETVEIGGVEAPTSDVDPYVTVLVRWQDLSPEQRAWVIEVLKPDPIHGPPFPPDTLIITDFRSKIERLLRRPIPIPSR